MYQDEPIPEVKSTLGSRLFGGRLNVRSFVVGNLIFFALVVGVVWLAVVFNPRNRSGLEMFLFLCMVAAILVNMFFSISFGIRRLHDHGRPGAWILLAFVPIASLFLSVYLLMPGEKEENYYGPDTRGRLSIRDIVGLW